jgi:dephospho-CoA kinase
MLKIGITGGIGSGKTTVCKVFELLGVPVYYADDASKELLVSDPVIKKKIVELFGEGILDEQQLISRKKVAAHVFGKDAELKKLNNILHPAVGIHFEHWLEKNAAFPYIIKEAAILFESGAYRKLDQVIAVTAPEALRISRVMKRDGSEKEQVLSRIKAQLPEEERIKRSQFVIVNNEEEMVIPQVLRLHEQFLTAKHG